MPGILYLIPVPLGPVAPETCLPPDTLAVAHRLDHFVVERAKTARAHLKAMGHPLPMQSLVMQELNEHTPAAAVADLLAPLLAGHDLGLLSEAGCPAVADPGANLVRAAHAAGIALVPLVGPSSILLALMASGLGGQRFSFHGYLPAKEPERSRSLQALEKAARRDHATQLFIETPYRAAALLDALAATLSPAVLVSVGADLGLPGQFIRTQRASDWRGQGNLVKDRLVVFGIGV
ncbi:MAG: SAM-dependent methyltransferase [Hydrogenophilales bacterium 16-64-46]|nr:MAG: SAM-dependent methyltransferase [Hydrogenophilales bacterium 12-64-13]OYZ04267.1 MAG: SAM-dependent methyltransferase [Hydrogenophilales bacterium 16-64-46]OZA38525.1 MAG: SAM-dependent methyltransferase [Hydrogenophilales bacterium 17-64-34]HQT00178.1 SAM-dependent methyltransferase [Thiobacillus sp.]